MQQIDSLKPMKYRLYVRDSGVEATIAESDNRAVISDAYYKLKRQRCYARISVNGKELPIFHADKLTVLSRKERGERAEMDMPTGPELSTRHIWST